MEGQTGPLSEAQQQELAGAERSTTSTSSNNGILSMGASASNDSLVNSAKLSVTKTTPEARIPTPQTSGQDPAPPRATYEKERTNAILRGGVRNNPADWKKTVKIWDAVRYEDLLSLTNGELIKNERTPIVDDARIRIHSQDAGLRGEK